MKKSVILLLLIVPFIIKAATYTSTINGNWNVAATWGGAGVPGATDIAIINTTVTITANQSVDSVTINSGKTLSLGAFTFTVDGNFTNNGTFSAATNSTVDFNTASKQYIKGSSSTTFYNFTVNTPAGTDTVFLKAGITISNKLLISAGVLDSQIYQIVGTATGTMAMSAGTSLLLGLKSSNTNVSFPTNYTSSNISLTAGSLVDYQANTNSQTISVAPAYANLTISSGSALTKTPAGTPLDIAGNLTITSPVTLNESTNTITLIGNLTLQGALAFTTGTLTIRGNFTNNGSFSAGTGTVLCTGTAAQTIGGTSSTTFYNLGIATGTNTVTLGNNETINNTLVISTGTLDVSTSNYSLTILKNFTDDATFTCRSGTVNMTGTSNQTIGGTVSGITFYNLIANQGAATDTVFLSLPITVNNNLTETQGVFDCQTYQVTGNASGTLSLVSGTSLILGLKSSATNVSFPTSFTTAHISLNSNSTVLYTSNIAQTISTYPSAYGNLILSTGSSSTTKTTATSSLTVAGSLTINNNTTMSGLSSGTLTLGGNLTNNGTYTVGSGTVLFDGSGIETIGGTSHITFYNMTASNGGSGTVQPSYNTTISNNLSITSGTLDVTSSNYNLIIGGNFTETGGALNPHGNIVTMDGSSPTLGGSSTINLNKLNISTLGTTTLGGNINATSDITINAGATLTASTYNISIAGNFTDNGTFNCNTSTFDFNNNGNQCVSGSHSSETFQNLTVSALSKLGTSCVVNIDGTILIQPGGHMACVCH